MLAIQKGIEEAAGHIHISDISSAINEGAKEAISDSINREDLKEAIEKSLSQYIYLEIGRTAFKEILGSAIEIATKEYLQENPIK